MTIALVDGDIIAFRSAASAENEEFWIARARADEMLHRCLEAVKAESYQLWLSGEHNFRYEIFPEYKANRTAPKPRHLEPLREHLVKAWDARLTEGYEADDALGINTNEDTIICSIDKDLLQISGHHWNFVKEEHTYVGEQEGIRRFYTQCLIGDRSDNVPGVDGIGKVKASRIIKDGMSERECFDATRIRFSNDKRFKLTGDLLYILRNEGERWSEMKKEWFNQC